MKFELDITSLMEIHGPFEKEIVIPENVDYIMSGAIRHIKEVEKLVMQDAVSVIETQAVFDCPNLTTVEIGRGIEEIEKKAFDKCKKLKTVIINRKKGKVKIHQSAFPSGTEIFFEGTAPKTDAQKKRYDISLKELRNTCTVTSRNTGYSINDFGKDGRIHWILKNGKYVYVFHDRVTDKKVFIPDTIDGKNIGHIAYKSIPDDAVIICSGEMFRKLNKAQRASAAIAFLQDSSLFGEDQVVEIKEFMKKSPDSLIAGLVNCSVEQLEQFISITSPKASVAEALNEAFNNKPVLKARIMEYQNESGFKKKPAGGLSLDKPKKMKLADYQKIWNFGRINGMSSTSDNYDYNEPIILLHQYLGQDKYVTIPAFIGKTPVRELCENAIPDFVESVEFEGEDIIISDSLKNCAQMTDQNGFVIASAGSRKILTAYVGDRNTEILKIPEGVT